MGLKEVEVETHSSRGLPRISDAYNSKISFDGKMYLRFLTMRKVEGSAWKVLCLEDTPRARVLHLSSLTLRIFGYFELSSELYHEASCIFLLLKCILNGGC